MIAAAEKLLAAVDAHLEELQAFAPANAPKPALAKAAKDARNDGLGKPRPVIVCLCGSTRFREEYEQANRLESLSGRIVLSVGFFSHAEAADARKRGESSEGNKEIRMGEAIARDLDELHLSKIDLADEVLIVSDASKYVGVSTRREILYAQAKGKKVRWLVTEYPQACRMLPPEPVEVALGDDEPVPPGYRL